MSNTKLFTSTMFVWRSFRCVQRLTGQPIYSNNATNVSRPLRHSNRFNLLTPIREFQMRWCSSTQPSKIAEPEFELTDTVLDAELAKNQKLARFDKPMIQGIHETLMRAGFNAENAFKIIKKNPAVVTLPPKKLENTLECWRGFLFTNSQFIQLFVQCPELLDFSNENELRSRFADIKMYAGKPKNVWRLLMASPNIIVDNPKNFAAKANYMLEEMKVDVSDAMKSGAFSHSLEKLKCRHMLLVRLGIFKEKSKKATPLDSNKNPRVARIFDTSDSEFVRKICGISIAELNAFNALYKRELEEQREMDHDEEDLQSDEEDESDEENEEFVGETEEYDPRDRLKYVKHGNKKNVKKLKHNKWS